MTDEAFAAALAAGKAEANAEIRAISVRYAAHRDEFEIGTARHGGFLIPRSRIGALQDVPVEELDGLDVWPDGSAIELESRGVRISVHGLLAAPRKASAAQA